MPKRIKYVMVLGALIGAFLYAESASLPVLNVFSEALWGAVIGAFASALVVFLAPVVLILLMFLLAIMLLAITVPAGLTKSAHDALIRFLWGEK